MFEVKHYISMLSSYYVYSNTTCNSNKIMTNYPVYFKWARNHMISETPNVISVKDNSYSFNDFISCDKSKCKWLKRSNQPHVVE